MMRFTSLLAFVAGAGAIAIVVLRVMPTRGARAVLAGIYDGALWLAWLVAAVAMAGSLYFSESAGFIPCRYCWFQRIAMFSLVVVLFVGALRRDRDVRWYAVPLAGFGMVISIYHYIIEWHPQLEGGSCEVFAPCTTPYFREFGFVTLALMAMCGFAAILALLLLPRALPFEPDSAPLEDQS